jgi:hypothetical protein
LKRLGTPTGVTFIALVIGILAAIRLLAVFGWDPTVFTAFGEEATATTEYAEAKLGRQVLTRPHQGHDGKFFFVQANDPFVLDPKANAAVLDRPVYRSQRMLYPLVAGGGGLFPADVIVWALPVVNILMLAAGSWAVARIAARHGASPWVGLAFAVNIGVLSELFIDGAGIVAFALASLAALALEEDRLWLASACFVGAALTREVMAVFIAFVVLVWLIRRREIRWALFVPAAAAVLGWAVYLRARIDLPADVLQVKELTPVPFSGLVEALTSGHAVMADYLVITVFLVLLLVVTYRGLKSEVYLTWGTLGFVALAPFLTVFVWQKSFDISRALAPLLTVFVLEMFVTRAKRLKLDSSASKRLVGA